MRIAFMGTPQFSVPSLVELIASGHEIVAVYTQPPRPAGRGHKLRPSPVQEVAELHGLEVRSPLNSKEETDRQAFADLDLDVAVVVAYGLILPQAVLDMPKYGCLNLHGSLLPRWRGAAPVQRAIMAGDAQTGIQLMQMEKGLDTGPVLLSEVMPIGAQDTSESMHEKLAQVGAGMLPRALAALERGGLQAVPQSQEGIMYAEKIMPEEARIDWSRSAHELDCHIRGLSPFPGAWFEIESADKAVRCKALMSSLSGREPAGVPGEIVSLEGGITVTCGSDAICLTNLQRAGKKVQSTDEFLRGFDLRVGQVLK